MWHTGLPAADQCEGCTYFTGQALELSYLHSRDVTFAVFCEGPYPESSRYRDFMGWQMPWYSAQASLDALLVGRRIGMMHIVCYTANSDLRPDGVIDDVCRILASLRVTGGT